MSPYVLWLPGSNVMRTVFRVICPVGVVNRGGVGIILELENQEFAKMYLITYRFTEKFVRPMRKKKVRGTADITHKIFRTDTKPADKGSQSSLG